MIAYRAEQVGSLLRPASLLAARGRWEAGELSREELTRLEDGAIREALAMQRDAGLDVYSDGEYRRSSFLDVLAGAVDGFIDASQTMPWKGGDGERQASHAKVAAARLEQRDRLAAHEAGFLLEAAPGPFKVTLPSPMIFGFWSFRAGVSDAAYATPAELMTHIATIVRDEVRALTQAGVTYVQIDNPSYAYLMDEELRAGLVGTPWEPERLLTDAIAADNLALSGAEGTGATVAVHLCRGNSRSRWYAEGSYEPVAEEVFDGLRADRLLLEYDTDRSGGFEPLRFVPAGRTVVLGLVSSKVPELESEDDLLARVDDAARYVDEDRLALSPQCGFASVNLGNKLSWDDQLAKLRLVAATARRRWGS